MTRVPSLMVCLTIASFGVAVASCETPGHGLPPVADLTVEPKPVPSEEVLTSRIAGELHDNAIEAWGERGWQAVARLCQWSVDMGAEGLSCPRPPRRPDPG